MTNKTNSPEPRMAAKKTSTAYSFCFKMAHHPVTNAPSPRTKNVVM